MLWENFIPDKNFSIARMIRQYQIVKTTALSLFFIVGHHFLDRSRQRCQALDI